MALKVNVYEYHEYSVTIMIFPGREKEMRSLLIIYVCECVNHQHNQHCVSKRTHTYDEYVCSSYVFIFILLYEWMLWLWKESLGMVSRAEC